jgi:hypothetical protein
LLEALDYTCEQAGKLNRRFLEAADERLITIETKPGCSQLAT